MHIIENVRHVAGKVGEKISGIFEKTGLANLARKTGFIQRSTSKIQGEDFVRLMTTEILGDETVTTEGLCDILRQINPEADISLIQPWFIIFLFFEIIEYSEFCEKNYYPFFSLCVSS